MNNSQNDSNKVVDQNAKNAEEFKNLMDNASRKYDSYLDKNNAIVRMILFALLAFIIVGCIYYAILWLNN